MKSVFLVASSERQCVPRGALMHWIIENIYCVPLEYTTTVGRKQNSALAL